MVRCVKVRVPRPPNCGVRLHAKHFLARRPSLRHRAALGGECDEYLHRLLSLLAPEDARHTLAWILAQTGWTEIEALRALAILIEDGRVTELKEPPSDSFYYVSTSAFLPLSDVESRLHSLDM